LHITQRAGPHQVSSATLQSRTHIDVTFTANSPITKIVKFVTLLSRTVRKFPCSRVLLPEPDNSNLQPHAQFLEIRYVICRLEFRSVSLAPFQPDLYVN